MPIFGLTGFWNPIPDLWVKPFIQRTVEDSALQASSAYVYTTGGLDISYFLQPNIRLNGHADYSMADFNELSGAQGNSTYDQYVTFRVGLMYLPTRNFYVEPTYQFVHRTSNQFNNDFDQNVIMVRLGARM